jgi:RNA polymerase sigma-70 factor (ECF subfamily)
MSGSILLYSTQSTEQGFPEMAGANERDTIKVAMRERELIARVIAGEVSVFHDLIRPYEGRIYAAAFAVGKNEADAEDIAQQSFLNAFHKLPAFRCEAMFGTWLFRIALNEARSFLRRQKARRIESLVETNGEQRKDLFSALCDKRKIPSEAIEQNEREILLRQAIDELPRIYSEVLILRSLEELSVAETALRVWNYNHLGQGPRPSCKGNVAR